MLRHVLKNKSSRGSTKKKESCEKRNMAKGKQRKCLGQKESHKDIVSSTYLARATCGVSLRWEGTGCSSTLNKTGFSTAIVKMKTKSSKNAWCQNTTPWKHQGTENTFIFFPLICHRQQCSPLELGKELLSCSITSSKPVLVSWGGLSSSSSPAKQIHTTAWEPVLTACIAQVLLKAKAVHSTHFLLSVQ